MRTLHLPHHKNGRYGRYLGLATALLGVGLIVHQPIGQAASSSVIPTTSTTMTSRAVTSTSAESSAVKDEPAVSHATTTKSSSATESQTATNTSVSGDDNSKPTSWHNDEESSAAETATVTVNYVNQRTGQPLRASQKLTGKIGDQYDLASTAVKMAGYMLQPSTVTNGRYKTDTTFTWRYAPKQVTVTVKGYLYDDAQALSSFGLWDSFTRRGYVGDTMTVQAGDYTEEDLALKPGSADRQTIKLKAQNNVVKFYYVDIDQPEISDIETTQTTAKFHDMTVTTQTERQQLGMLVGVFGKQSVVAMGYEEDNQTLQYLIGSLKQRSRVGELKPGVNTIKLAGATYHLTWGPRVATVYRQSQNGRVMGFEVDTTTGKVLTAYVTNRQANGQWLAFHRDYQTGKTTTTALSVKQNGALAHGMQLTSTGVTSRPVKGKKVVSKRLPQTDESPVAIFWVILGSSLLVLLIASWRWYQNQQRHF